MKMQVIITVSSELVIEDMQGKSIDVVRDAISCNTLGMLKQMLVDKTTTVSIDVVETEVLAISITRDTYNPNKIECTKDDESHEWMNTEEGLVCCECKLPQKLIGYDSKVHKFAKPYEDAGYIVDDAFPWCDEHCSQKMLNSNGKLECVVCTGNELVATPTKNVHTEHCCKHCGCKYGDDVPDDNNSIECDVVAGRLKQSFKCGETGTCQDDWW